MSLVSKPNWDRALKTLNCSIVKLKQIEIYMKIKVPNMEGALFRVK